MPKAERAHSPISHYKALGSICPPRETMELAKKALKECRLASPTLRFELGMGKQRMEPKTAWKDSSHQTGQKEATWHIGTSSRAQSPYQSE